MSAAAAALSLRSHSCKGWQAARRTQQHLACKEAGATAFRLLASAVLHPPVHTGWYQATIRATHRVDPATPPTCPMSADRVQVGFTTSSVWPGSSGAPPNSPAHRRAKGAKLRLPTCTHGKRIKLVCGAQPSWRVCKRAKGTQVRLPPCTAQAGSSKQVAQGVTTASQRPRDSAQLPQA